MEASSLYDMGPPCGCLAQVESGWTSLVLIDGETSDRNATALSPHQLELIPDSSINLSISSANSSSLRYRIFHWLSVPRGILNCSDARVMVISDLLKN